MPTPNGVELWRGPSRFNGEEIVVLATFRSRNEKTGDMIQVWILRADKSPLAAVVEGGEQATCGTCPLQHKASGGEGLCYVNKMYVKGTWEAWQRGQYPKFNEREHGKYFRDRVIRWGAYGDPAMFPARVAKPLFKLARGWTGYTHQWRDAYAQDWKPYVMASVESPEARQRAKSSGWRTFRVRRLDEPMEPKERMCPASPEGGNKAHCESCQACDGSARGSGLADISIIVHGKKGNAVRFTRLSIGGRFAEPTRTLQAAA